MFTVLIAEKETIKLFEETKMFFGPLLDNEKVVFCEWNKYGDTLENMVPDLYDIIEFREEWRAVILYDEDREKLNPFDFTGYSESYYSDVEKNWDFYKNRRKCRIHSYEKASTNPLVKLTTGLTKLSEFKTLVVDNDDYEAVINDEMKISEFMLKNQLAQINCYEVAMKIGKYQREALLKFVAESDTDNLLSLIKSGDAKGIMEIIPESQILDFIKLVGNDPSFYDPEYSECLIENTKKAKLLRTIAARFSMKDKLPTEVICLSPRTFNFEILEQDTKWKKKDENSYTRFAQFNMYNESLKFVLFDILPKDNKKYRFDQIKLLCLLLLICDYEMPKGLVTANHVYRANIDFDKSIVSRICEGYLSKLKATEVYLHELEQQVDAEKAVPVDDRTARRLFESDVQIPVKINNDFKRTDLYAQYKEIGLSTDCPVDEESSWNVQFRQIMKQFVRYLREPKRALKNSVTEGLHKNNKITDDRTLLLSENQIEDVKIHLYEEEQKMVDTSTSHLFNVKKFNEQLKDADKDIRRTVAQRMTKGRTVFIALLAIGAYLLGFLPLIFTNLNTTKSFTTALLITLITVLVFAIAGFIYLFVLKRKLIHKYRNFNAVMSGICTSINRALAQFSKYLSSACNVMRDHSVLQNRDSAVTRMKRVIKYHRIRVRENITNVSTMFVKYVDFNNVDLKESEPYYHDFTILKDYEYEMPSICVNKRIEFLQHGYEIVAPVDYVNKVILAREELYD